jgi:glutamine amidotransferase
MEICIVDYGMGNLRSVEKALCKLGFDARLVTKPDEVRNAQSLILPGVGAFGDAMKGLKDRGLCEPIIEHAHSGRPLMGICLGMQILFESSEEDPGVAGLSLLSGEVRRFRDKNRKIPHMGWNSLQTRADSKMLSGLGDLPFVYFTHSYYVLPTEPRVAAAITEYGIEFVSAVESENICGTQFHPEKSQQVGLRILQNFCNTQSFSLK